MIIGQYVNEDRYKDSQYSACNQTQEHIKYIHHYQVSVLLKHRDGSLSVNKRVVLRRVKSLKIDLFQPCLLHMATS